MNTKNNIIYAIIILLAFDVLFFSIFNSSIERIAITLIFDVIFIYFFYKILRNQGLKKEKLPKGAYIVVIFAIIGFILMIIGFPLLAYGAIQQDKNLIRAALIVIALFFLSYLGMMLSGIYIDNKRNLKTYLKIIIGGIIAIGIDGLLMRTFQDDNLKLVLLILFFGLVIFIIIFIFVFPLIILTSSALKKFIKNR